MDNNYTAPLTPEENKALQEAFTHYLIELNLNTAPKEERIKIANSLTSQYKSVFLENPHVKDKYNSSLMKEKESNYFKVSTNEAAHLTTVRPLEDYERNRKKIDNPVKARLLIFALEIKGFYKRPPEKGRNHLHVAIMEELFKKSRRFPRGNEKNNAQKIDTEKDGFDYNNGYFHKDIISGLVGTYQLFRLSLNNSFPGCVAVHTLRIFRDEYDQSVVHYTTLNSYKQFQSQDKSKGLRRQRRSSGNLYNFQQQILFLGGTDYSHLDEFESGNQKSNYPEIMLMHAHTGDRNSIRGLLLGQYPFLNLPISTSVFMSKLDDETAAKLKKLEEIEPEKYGFNELKLLANYYGNIDPNLNTQEITVNDLTSNIELSIDENKELISYRKNLHDRVKSIHSFIQNSIEQKYSNMLSP
ncbi:hypothetical protein AN214_04014 [Pseudoalteromonas sp. P1-9]|uniref:hypothetical protein n=1 Tax=Pseudoalteromonas sp. P1-9 TaxID=1710354 RepID=UPI0006D5E892|nr:hypothetical protein [Pseudoalteromonas sp. P1-9]KPV93915.1 hypothetical protein AN214_04014 [Pseudoalteromonas sp. P1-9]